MKSTCRVKTLQKLPRNDDGGAATGRSLARPASCQSHQEENEEQKHARVLGLKTKVDAADVKRVYSEMLAKYHPDKVNHLGDEFKVIAESRTREILEAYDYFREKLDIR